MYIEIQRIRQLGENIEGHLLIDSRSDLGQNLQQVCDTLENLHSSLPLGQYRIELQKCPFRSRKMPIVITPSTDPQVLTPCSDPQALPPSLGPQDLPPSFGPQALSASPDPQDLTPCSDPQALSPSPDPQALTPCSGPQVFSPSPNPQALPPSCLCSICAKADYVGVNSTPRNSLAEGEALFCPMIAPGNGIHNRHDGGILVGLRGARGLLLHPMTTFDRLYERIRRSAERGNEVKLMIR